ncbi:hypothetical protein THRCLA_00712, partial [Thraustotheca clavata]
CINQWPHRPEDFTWEMHGNIAQQGANAIVDIHELGIVHLDVKSVNFICLEKDMSIKIADFGQAHFIKDKLGQQKVWNEVVKLGKVGTPGWTAPEVAIQNVLSEKMKKIDIYSLGVKLHELDSLTLPSPHFQLHFLKSEYINPVFGVIDYDDQYGTPPCLVIEDNTTTSLYQYLTDASVFKQYLGFGKKLRIAYEIASGLKFLHDNGILHKLLSPSTILMTSNLSIKLSSFGMEGVDETTGTSGGCCSVAPEVRKHRTYTSASDVYAFGLILMDLAGYRVHTKDDFAKLLAMSVTTCPTWYQELVVMCTKSEANERPSIDQVQMEIDKHLKDCLLDMPKGCVGLMEENNNKLTQLAIVTSNSNDVVNVYGGKYDDIDVLIKRPNDTCKNKNITPVDHLLNEFVISTRVQSQNIVNQFGIVGSNSASPAVVICKMNNGSLFDYIARIEDKSTFSEVIKLHIAISIAQALVDLHEMDYVHCDVHSSNSFIDTNRQVKLGNLILAQPEGMLFSDVLFEYVHYLAPEVKDGKPYTKAADVYAFGKFLISLDLCEQDAPDEYTLSTTWCQKLVPMCCSEEPNNRPTMSKVLEMLKSFKTDEVNFARVKLRGAVDIAEKLKDLPNIEVENITYGAQVGKGGYGAIQKGIYKDMNVAIKVFNDEYQFNRVKANDFAQEAIALYCCQSSKYVVKMYGICPEARQLVMELMDCNLTDYISQQGEDPKVFSWKTRINIAHQVTSAIFDLHKNDIIHLDIKSLNFLCLNEDLTIKLADFGQACFIKEEWPEYSDSNQVASIGNVGTSGWKAPELIMKRVFVKNVKALDIYSLGVILYELDSLKLPNAFYGDMYPEMIDKKIGEGNSKLPFSDSCPNKYKEIALNCMFYTPERRPKAESVKHSFYGNNQKLEKHFDEASADFQVSRASYIDLCNRIEGKINTITDSLKREQAFEKHLNEKMEFYAAIEDGRIVLGDTLFHIAVRAGHVNVVLFLLSKGLRENIPNFRGQLVFECCRHSSIQVIMDDVVLVHEILGYDYDDESKVHRLVKSLRLLWPLWMYDSTEATSLIQVISDTRTSHPQYAKFLKIACTMTERYRNLITQQGLHLALQLLKENDLKAYDAKRTFHKWPTPDKLQVVWDVCFLFDLIPLFILMCRYFQLVLP